MNFGRWGSKGRKVVERERASISTEGTSQEVKSEGESRDWRWMRMGMDEEERIGGLDRLWV